MKRILIKLVIFAVGFVLIFVVCQRVLRYKWSVNGGNYSENIDYAALSPESIDVLCFGTSEIWAGYHPIISYEQKGITGYNLGTSFRSAITVYYQLLYALKYQTPQIVICDFASLYEDQLPSDEEPLYRKIVDCMPDKDIKSALINDICRVDGSQSYLDWKFPILRYHSRWSELESGDFTEDYRKGERCAFFRKGAFFCDNVYDDGTYAITPELWDYSTEESTYSEISLEYYSKFIDECVTRGIKVVAVVPPKIGDASLAASRWNSMKSYFDSKGVDYLNYNNYEQVQRMNLSVEKNYYDEDHLNNMGATIFSKVLAEDLDAKYDLPDHRGDEGYKAEWEDALEEFYEIYPRE